MSMNEKQAKQLGALISAARTKHRLSVRELAERVDVHHSWIGYLEQGRYLDPAPDRLARIAQELGLSVERINRITKGAVLAALPRPDVYFRTKYGLSAEQAAQVERYVDRLRRAA